MKKLSEAMGKFEFHQAVRFQSPIILADLAPGYIIRVPVDGFVGVQVHGEQDMRSVSIDNIYVEGVAMLEVLPSYTDEQLHTIGKALNTIDRVVARTIIERLETVGFDVDYEDFRTIQGDYHYKFDFHIPPAQAEKLIVHAVTHRPSFCARWGHAWNWPEEMPNGTWCAECSHCGLEKSGDTQWAKSVWTEMSRCLVVANN